jgi:CBS domain-containing protein
MLVTNIMTRGVQCAHPDMTIREAAEVMKDFDVGVLPVCDDDDRLVGMLTDRDIAVRAVAEGKDPRTTRASDIMTPEVVYCFEEQDVVDAAKLMEAKQIRRLVVLNSDKRLVGILSLCDLAIKTRDEMLVGEAVEAISGPTNF